MGIIGLLCAAMAWAANADDLFKCQDAAGKISIQSTACAKGSTQVWRRSSTPEPATTPEQRAAAEAKRARDQQTVRELSEVLDKRLKDSIAPPPPVAAVAPATPVDAAAAPADPCQLAQAFVGALRSKPWLGMTDEQMQRVYGWVAEQCKVVPPGDG